MITGKTKVLAILGNPVTHSLSPQMHAGWIADHGLDAAYVALQLEKDGVEDTMRALKGVGLHGANITVPFKEAAAAAADICSADAAELGVANTFVWRDGLLEAHNTDARGAQRALAESYSQEAEHLLVIGAGGAARAIAYGLPGKRITIVNRTRQKADQLVTFLATLGFGDARARDWEELPAAFADADVIVNASTLGMTGQASHEWPMSHAKPDAIVVDAVYAPLETDLLKAARARGLRTVDGLGMLIHQGALAFEIWFGIEPDTKKARERLLATLAARA